MGFPPAAGVTLRAHQNVPAAVLGAIVGWAWGGGVPKGLEPGEEVPRD